jgi:hypothetical protein
MTTRPRLAIRRASIPFPWSVLGMGAIVALLASA